MLVRATVRSLRPQSTPVPIRAALPSLQSRSYAKTKPKKPFEYRAPTGPNSTPSHGHTPQQSNGPVAGAIKNQWNNRAPTNGGSPPDYSKEQDEFQTSAPNDRNTAPQSSSPSSIDPAEIYKRPIEPKPTRPLPDLTQGIPSTLDSEISSSSERADPKSLDITEASSQPGGQDEGDLPKSAYISSLERRRNRIANYAFGSAILTVILGVVYAGRNWDNEEEEVLHPEAPSGWGFGLFWNRAWARYHTTMDYYNEPAFPKLLPDPDPVYGERPYTLVLSMEDLLVHSEWSREHGWRMAKRPGVDYFLRYLNQYYELVVFTSVPSMLGGPIIQKLDPYQVVMWRLFREATRYKKGKYIKDLSFLNRDLSKVILLDTEASHAELQPENAIIIPKWKGDPNDKGLISLIPFLEFVGADSKDTREVLKSFEGTDLPTEFARREALHREKFLKELEETRAKRPRRSTNFFGSLLGSRPLGGPEGFETLSEAMEQGKTYNDLVRERGQKQYEMLEKDIRENGEKWLKEIAEEEKKMQDDAMKGMRSSITGVFPFGGGGGKPA